MKVSFFSSILSMCGGNSLIGSSEFSLIRFFVLVVTLQFNHVDFLYKVFELMVKV